MLGHTHKKILILIFSKFTCLFACKISTASLTSFWPCRREIANLLFYVIWACVATNTSNKSINLKKASTFISRQKINFILQILERSCELAVFGTLVLWYFGTLPTPRLILSSCRKLLDLSAGKKSTSFPMLLWGYCKDMKTYFGYFRHMTGYTHPKW